MKSFWKRILISIVLLSVAYFGGRLARAWKSGNDGHEAVRNIELDQFMGIKNYPMSGVILESKAGYVKVRLENGNVIEHSGDYTIY